MGVAVADSQQFAVRRFPIRKSRIGLWGGLASVLIAIYLFATVWLPYQQMRASVVEIARLGGQVTTRRDSSWQRQFARSLGYDSTVFLRVEDINLAHTPLTDENLRRLPALASVRSLKLAGTAISDAALQALSGSRELVNLDLHATRISNVGLSQIAHLDRIEHLDLSGTAIDDSALPHLRTLLRLQHLSLAATQITPAGLQEVSGLQLATLNIDAAIFTPETAAELQKLPTLFGVGLHSDRDGDAALRRLGDLHGLTHLRLVGRGFTEAGLPHLEGLHGLKNLSLEGTAIGPAAVERLRRSRPDCEIEQGRR